MNTILRTLLVWLVLLAVPFQGFAAAAMTCAHGVAAAPAQQHAKPPCHGDAATAASLDDNQHDGGQPHEKKCGNCASCWVGTAMAPASGSPAPGCCPCSCCPSGAVAPVAAVDPDLPERPPRTALA